MAIQKRPYVRRQQPAAAPQAPAPEVREPVRETRPVERVQERPTVLGRDDFGRIQVTGRDGRIISRTRTGAEDQFFIPREIIPDGWSYEWKRMSVYGERAQAHQTMLSQNGWEAVPAPRHDGQFMPPGYQGPIERDGLILMERPEVLTEEARAEDLRRARSQTNVNQQRLSEEMPKGFTTDDPAVPRIVKSRYEPSDVARPKLEIAPD